MNSIFETILAPLKPVRYAYCDYIADRIQRALRACKPDPIIEEVGRIQSDLHPVRGYFISTKKTIEVVGRNGINYRVTVEEIE